MKFISEQFIEERTSKQMVYAIHKYGNMMHDLDNELRAKRGKKKLTKQERLKRDLERFKKKKAATLKKAKEIRRKRIETKKKKALSKAKAKAKKKKATKRKKKK